MKVFVIAGEPSGDALGQAVMQGLRQLRPDVRFEGIGGPLMMGEGLQSQFPMAELSVMGLAEILPKYFALKRRIAETAEAILAAKPDVVLTIDSPDFCLRVAALVRTKSDVKIVHYVAPSVWAWRAGRAAKMARHVDHVLALLPFEPPYMTAAGMTCDFVGHPIAAQEQARDDEVAAFQAEHGIEGPSLLLLPGSRKGEVTRLLPVFEDVVARLRQDTPDLRVILPLAANTENLVRERVVSWKVAPTFVQPAVDRPSTQVKRAAFRAADAALAASGTVSLELAAAGTPMVIAYDMAWATRQIMQRMLRVDTVTLVNLVTDTRVVPEFIGAACRPEKITPAVAALLKDPSSQSEALAQTMGLLGQGGAAPGLRAARSILQAIET